MTRVPNWHHHLVEWANGLIGQPFVWGQTDCHALAAEAYRVLHGSPIPGLPVWSSRGEALQLHGAGWDLPSLLPTLGATPVELGYVRCGDLVVEPLTDHVHPVLVALGESRFLTAIPGETVCLAHVSAIAPGAIGWRFAING